MKIDTYHSLGMPFKLSVPETADEFNQLAKNADACRNEAVNNIVYRSAMPEIRDTFLHGNGGDIVGVEKETSIAREFERRELKSKGSDGTAKSTEVWTESEAAYYNRVKVTLVKNGIYPTAEAVVAHFQPMMDKVAAKVVFDPSATERKERAPRRLSKENLAIAQRYIDLGKADKFAALLTSKVGRTVEPTLESLATAVAEDLHNQQARQQQEMLNVDLG